MKLNDLEQRLYDVMAGMQIIDAHDHLPSEQEYVASEYSGMHLFAGYIWCDLLSAGIPLEFRRTMRQPGYKPVEYWWPQIRPYWDYVKHSSYAKPLLITARDLYGIAEVNDQTIHTLAERVRRDNKPGLYTSILKDKCNIRAVLNNPDVTKVQTHPLLRLVAWAPEAVMLNTWDRISEYGKTEGIDVRSFEDLLEVHRRQIERLKTDGAVALKVHAASYGEPVEQQARKTFEVIKNTGSVTTFLPLRDYLFWRILDKAAELDLTVAVHSGMWDDFRKSDPKWIIPWAIRCPNTRLDLFHLGWPYVRDSMTIAKNFPNVTLNLSWTYVISQHMTLNALEELFDLVPLNKISAFGADYVCSIQKTYGHLVMARQTLAGFFARRIQAGDLNEDQAGEIARMWLHDNPARIYKV